MLYLLCTDGSEVSARGFEHLKELLRKDDRVIILNVKPEQRNAELQRKVQDILKSHQEDLAELGFEAELLQPAGYAREVIVRVAEEVEADIIVLGSVGMSPARGSTLGSTSEYVCVHSGAACLVVK